MENEIEDGKFSDQKCQINPSNTTWKHELEQQQCRVENLEEKLVEVNATLKSKEDVSKRELELLWRRVTTTARMLSYLRSKAKIMAVPHLAHKSCGIRHQEGVGLVDKHGVPLSDWSKDSGLSSLERLDDDVHPMNNPQVGYVDANDGAYVDDILKSVCIVTDVMESLVKRVIMAETEAAYEKEQVKLGREENKRKTLQIESMTTKVEEMEKFALGTNNVLNDMRKKVEDMVEETSRQRELAAENEQELHRVKHDFESLKSFVSSLISVRETLLSSERQFQTIEKLFDRLIAKTAHLENEKFQKEAEVQKLIEENIRLRALLDKKEAQLLAMNEQCKFMALDGSGI